MLKIYGRPNSLNVRKVLWLCEEIGIPYQRTDFGRGYTPTSDPEFTKLSIFGVVPVIDDDGFILRESNTIVRYLAAKHGRDDLYPTEPRARARVEMWMDYAASDLMTGLRIVFQGKDMKLAPWADPKLVAWGEAEWNKQFQRLDRELAAGGPYIAGPSLTIGDIPLGVAVNRYFTVAFDKPDVPHVRAYYDRLSERPGYRAHGRNGMP